MTHQCEQFRSEIASYQDGELSREDRAVMSTHLAQCSSCQQYARVMAVTSQRLRALKNRSKAELPLHVWANATKAWDRRDALHQRRLNVRFALVGALVFLMAMGVVWANLMTSSDFPVQFALSDFRATQNQDTRPQLVTSDADVAAQWLRARLDSSVPPLNLSLTQAQLIGADIVHVSGNPVGRLLYRKEGQRLAIYIAPNCTHFPNLANDRIAGRVFAIAKGSKDNENIGLFGWQQGHLGYGLVIANSERTGASPALNAQHASESPGP